MHTVPAPKPMLRSWGPSMGLPACPIMLDAVGCEKEEGEKKHVLAIVTAAL